MICLNCSMILTESNKAGYCTTWCENEHKGISNKVLSYKKTIEAKVEVVGPEQFDAPQIKKELSRLSQQKCRDKKKIQGNPGDSLRKVYVPDSFERTVLKQVSSRIKKIACELSASIFYVRQNNYTAEQIEERLLQAGEKINQQAKTG